MGRRRSERATPTAREGARAPRRTTGIARGSEPPSWAWSLGRLRSAGRAPSLYRFGLTRRPQERLHGTRWVQLSSRGGQSLPPPWSFAGQRCALLSPRATFSTNSRRSKGCFWPSDLLGRLGNAARAR